MDTTQVVDGTPRPTPTAAPPPAPEPASADGGQSRLLGDTAMMKRIAGLDPFPPVAQRLIALANDPDVSIREVERLLATDIALTTRVLRLAGSSLYGRRPAANLHAALLRIGTAELRRLVITATASASFDALGAQLWRYSLRCGLLAQGLVRAAGVSTAADPFLCGLLHDVGVLMMYRLHGAAYSQLHGAPGHDDLCDRELAHFGHTHGDVGGVIVSRWQLMTALDYVAQYHHDVVWCAGLELKPRLRDLLAAVVLARYLSIDAPTREELGARDVVRLRLGLREADLGPLVQRAEDEVGELAALLA